MSIAPLPRTAGLPLSHQIREVLVGQIASGTLAPGERLVETRLAAEFGTSQAPVREALRELASIGLVENRPRRGTFVQPFVQQTLIESYVVRAALEEAATRLAMGAGALPIDALRVDVAEMFAAAERLDTRGFAAASVAFHAHIVRASGNTLLVGSWEALQIAARTEVTLLVADVDLHALATEHERLFEVMAAGDIEAACAHARGHQWAFTALPHDAGSGSPTS